MYLIWPNVLTLSWKVNPPVAEQTGGLRGIVDSKCSLHAEESSAPSQNVPPIPVKFWPAATDRLANACNTSVWA